MCVCVCVVYSRLFRTEDAKVEFHSVYVVFFPFLGGCGGVKEGQGKDVVPLFLK